MKLSRSSLLALIVFVVAIPMLTSKGQTNTVEPAPQESVTDFVLFNTSTAVIPKDMGLAARVRYSNFGDLHEGHAQVFAALFGAVQIDCGYGLREKTNHFDAGLKAPILNINKIALALRYEFDSYAINNVSLDEEFSSHSISALFTRRHGAFMVSVEMGAMYSAHTTKWRDLVRVGMVYHATEKHAVIMEFQRYADIDLNYPDVMMFGFRVNQWEWLTWELGLAYYNADTRRDSGGWVALIFHPFEQK